MENNPTAHTKGSTRDDNNSRNVSTKATESEPNRRGITIKETIATADSHKGINFGVRMLCIAFVVADPVLKEIEENFSR